MTYRPGHNQCVECDAEAIDKRMFRADHAPLYDDVQMQRDIALAASERLYGRGLVDWINSLGIGLVASYNEHIHIAVDTAAKTGVAVAMMRGNEITMIAHDEFFAQPEPNVTLYKGRRDTGHPRSPKASRRKGRSRSRLAVYERPHDHTRWASDQRR